MKGWGLEKKELLLLHTFKNKETNKNPEKWYRERNITKAHWLVLSLKRKVFCVWALTVIGVLLKLTGPNAHISNTRNSSVDYYGYFIINQDATEQDLVCCIYNWWNEVSILHPRLLTIEAQTPTRFAWCSRWARSPLLGSSPRNFKFCSHIYSGPRFSHFSTARYQFPCNSLNRFFGNSCGCCITQEKSLMHIALECYLELRWFSRLVLL